MSTEHDVTVVRIGPVRKHPDADTLSITEVDGRPVVIRTGDFNEGDLAVYIPIDSLVPTSDERFAFLAGGSRSVDASGRIRIRAAKLRGIFSMGLLVRRKSEEPLDTDLRKTLGIEIWEPSVELTSSDNETDPGFFRFYDIESARKWHVLLQPSEDVVVTEKIHGQNGCWAYHNGRFWARSHYACKKRDPKCSWWHVAMQHGLEEKLARHPSIAIYGENYGQVGGFRYGLTKGPSIAAFDALDLNTYRWLDWDEFCDLMQRLEIPTVPVLYRGPWTSFEALAPLAEGPSVQASINGDPKPHVREGWVLKPAKDRSNERLGRVIMKLHGQGFLLKK